jgi:hypothetical protein
LLIRRGAEGGEVPSEVRASDQGRLRIVRRAAAVGLSDAS